VAAVDDRIGGVGTGRHHGVQRRNPGFDVGVVVEEGTERMNQYADDWIRTGTH